MQIDNIIAEAVSKAVQELYGVETPAAAIKVDVTRKNFEGNFTLMVFPWVNAAHKAP